MQTLRDLKKGEYAIIQEISDMYEKMGVFTQCQELLTPHEITDKTENGMTENRNIEKTLSIE